MKVRKKKLSSYQIIIYGFLLIIMIGSLLLMLPVSTRGNESASFGDALFTATSAVCVTGLVVRDTATYWSEFGQVVILLLIQIGGMGVVTMAVLIARVSGRKIGLMQRSTLQETLGAPQVGGIVRLTAFIIRLTVTFEICGAILLMPTFVKDFDMLKGIWYSLFHSVSAFCNAGFDLMGINSKFSSLTAYSGNPVVIFTIMGLIVIGGIGFLTWEDIASNRFHFRKYRMQSKVILSVTFLLIVIPALYFYLAEFTELGFVERICASLFQSVTTRTAGFNTEDLTLLSESGIAVMVLLMVIGGSPGSTAGGMKTTTLAVLFSSAIAVFKRDGEAHLFRRKIPDNTIRNAGAILMIYIVLFIGCGIFISAYEQIPLLPCVFETASAIGTVGLTLGITTQLHMVSRYLLIFLMFFGRVGGLTLVFAAISSKYTAKSRLPQEKIIVG